MDYIINQEQLNTKKIELNTMKTNVVQLTKDISSGYLSKVKGTEISSIINKIMSSSERLQKGYNNSSNWLDRYITEINNLEDKLCNIKATEFKSEFIDLFSKQTMPILKTKYEPDYSEAKKAFLGPGVDDLSQYTIAPNFYNMTKHMRMFDNTTGQEIPEDGHITLKKGETRVITVKLPTNTGSIGEIVRTTAADTSTGHGIVDKDQYTTSRSALNDDLNNPIYVNYQKNHWPSDRSLLHNNYYEWIIHADRVGGRQISQTCEYTCSAKPGWYAKAMIGLNITIVD